MLNLGVAVKPEDQVQPKIRSTPNGGCYISWFDNDPSGNPPFGYDVDLQRLDKHGVAQFPAGGIRLADLGMSYELIRKMRVVPIALNDFIAMALPGVIPALPLAATVMPVSEILKGILRLLG